jgi:hypothetical protein
MDSSTIMTDVLKFKAKVIDMGTKKIVIIPVAYHEQLKDFDTSKQLIVSLTEDKSS